MKRNSRIRRTATGVCLAGALIAGGQVPAAGAAQGPEADADAVTTLNSILIGGKVELNPRAGTGREVGALHVARDLVDAVSGKVVGPGSLRMAAATRGYTPGLRDCVQDGKNKQLEIFDHFDRYLRAKEGSIHFQYHPYRLPDAREVRGKPTTQWEVCSTGGGELDRYRLRQVGTAIALADKDAFRKIGQAWRSGSTPENYTLGLGFQVEKGPVSIKASLSQHPADKLLGSHRTPWSSFLNDYDRNAVVAWWQDNCIGRWWGCWPKSGSHDYQGAITHGLWEFPAGTEPADPAFFFVAFAAV